MIECEGWIFDFIRMDYLTDNGYTGSIMFLNETVFVQYGYKINPGIIGQEHVISSYHYAGHSERFAKEIYLKYVDWVFEERILNE